MPAELPPAAGRASAQLAEDLAGSEAVMAGEFNPGDRVLLQNHVTKRWSERGEILQQSEGSPRSYDVRVDNGPVRRRNIRFLRPERDRRVASTEPEVPRVPGNPVPAPPAKRGRPLGSRVVKGQEPTRRSARTKPGASSVGASYAQVATQGVPQEEKGILRYI